MRNQAEMFYQRSAVLTSDRLYRYQLARIWDRKRGVVLFIGLNPSTADESEDDPTIRRCMGYAKAWGKGGIYMGNLFAWRATDPHDLLGAAHESEDIVGPENDAWLELMHKDSDLTVACWGTYGELLHRGEKTRKMLQPLHVLILTGEGHPGHPLYLRKDLKPQLWK